MHLLPAAARSLISFAVVLGVLVFIHELGHYLAARWRGVHVEAFSIGFGRRLFGWTDRLGTEWKLCVLPLGGYVKLHAQGRPEDVSAAERADYRMGRTFYEKSVLSRAIVVAAGPVANFVLALVLFTVLFAVAGRPVAQPVVGQVVPGGAAQHAGLEVDDRILSVDGTPTPRFEDLQHLVAASPGRTVTLSVQRGTQTLAIPALIGSSGEGPHPTGLLGIRGGSIVFEPVGPGQAVLDGAQQTWTVTVQTLGGLWQIVTGHASSRELSGPIGIAQMSGKVAELGLASLVSFIALLSINLGLVNLFPIPVLDGGYLLFYLAEAVRGRPIPVRALEYGFRAGFALIAGLFVFVTWNDLSHLGLMRWVASLVG